jgi:hypothetical protein
MVTCPLLVNVASMAYLSLQSLLEGKDMPYSADLQAPHQQQATAESLGGADAFMDVPG